MSEQKRVEVDPEQFESYVEFLQALKQDAEAIAFDDTVAADERGGGEKGVTGNSFGGFAEAHELLNALSASREQAVAELGRFVELLDHLIEGTRQIHDRYRAADEAGSAEWDRICATLESATGIAYDPSWTDDYRLAEADAPVPGDSTRPKAMVD